MLHISKRLNAFLNVVGEGLGVLCLMKWKSITFLSDPVQEWQMPNPALQYLSHPKWQDIQIRALHSPVLTELPSKPSYAYLPGWLGLKCVDSHLVSCWKCEWTINPPKLLFFPLVTVQIHSEMCGGREHAQSLSILPPKVEPIRPKVSHLNP